MSTGTLTGTYEKADGTAQRGTVYINPSVDVVRDATGNVIMSGSVGVKLDDTGSFSVALAATDDATLDPVGVTYKVSLRGLPPVTGVVIHAGQSVDMADVTPVDPAAPTYAAWAYGTGGGGGGGGGAVDSVNGKTGTVVLSASDVGADPLNAAATAVTAHIAATDPHGDRAYTAAQIAALVNGAPGILDTLGEIATQLATDESAVGALTTAVNARLVAASNLADLANATTARTNLGLGNVNNTADTAKPVSTAQAAAIAAAIAAIPAGVAVVTYAGDVSATRPTASVVFWMDFPTQPTFMADSTDLWLAPGGGTILVGTAAPGSGDGNDGDVYVRTGASAAIYGPKASGSWPTGTSLVGPAGSAGRGVTSIARTSGTGAAGTTDTYTITYTDATTATFTVVNGSNGTNGTNGRGVSSIARTSGTGSPGTTDTYTITYTDATTATFGVYNGADGAPGGGSSLTVQDEGSSLSTAATTINFVGTGVTATGTGATKTVTIPGGSGAAVEPTTAPPATNTSGSVLGTSTNAAHADHTHAIGSHDHSNTANGGTLGLTALSATGSPSSTTFLRGDNTWATPAGGGGGGVSYDRAALLGPAGTIRANLDRTSVGMNSLTTTSGTLYLSAVYLYAGDVLTAVNMRTASSAVSVGTHSWGVLADASRNVVAVSADDTTATTAVNTVKTWAFTSTYTVASSGLYYVGYMQAATTLSALGANAMAAASMGLAPITFGTSNTAQTTPPTVSTTLTALTPVANIVPYVWLT